MRLAYIIQPRTIALILLGIAIFLAFQSLFTEYLVEEVIGDTSDHILVSVLDLFSVNLEDSLPTWYSTFLLLSAAILLSQITTAKYLAKEPYRAYWFGLTLIFLYLSLDEGAAIHEVMTDPLRETFNTEGYLYFAWQIAAVPLVIIVGLLYVRFVFKLPAHIRNLFILGGGIYLAGVLGFESISANQWYQAGGANFTYLTIATVEEFCEMLGVIIFVYALLLHITDMRYGFFFASPGQENPNTVRVPAWQPKGWLPALLAAVIVVNMLFFYGAHRIEPAVPLPVAVTALPAYQGVITKLVGDDTLTVYTTQAFNISDPVTYPMVQGLLPNFADVGVIAFPTYGASIILASDNLVFDQKALSNLLHTYGETSFVVYEPALVRSIVEAVSQQ